MELEQYEAEMEEMLLKCSVEEYVKFCRAHRIYVSDNPVVREIALHKSITGFKRLPIEFRRKSKAWLVQHKYDSWDDGDL